MHLQNQEVHLNEFKTRKPRLTEAEYLWRDAIQHYNVDSHNIFKNPSTAEKDKL